jgi:glutamate dehydrogenase (NADP+)
VATLASNGCTGFIEGVALGMTNGAMVAAKKRGMLHAPYKATTVGGSIFNGMTAGSEPLQLHAGETLDSRVEGTMADVYDEIKNTAKEFNTRGDLNAGANIAAFLRVADVMLAHGSV